MKSSMQLPGERAKSILIKILLSSICIMFLISCAHKDNKLPTSQGICKIKKKDCNKIDIDEDFKKAHQNWDEHEKS